MLKMPVWLQIFSIVFSFVLLGWAGWVTGSVLKHDKAITEIRCVYKMHQGLTDKIEKTLDKMEGTINQLSRNVVRIGMKVGLDTGVLERKHGQ